MTILSFLIKGNFLKNLKALESLTEAQFRLGKLPCQLFQPLFSDIGVVSGAFIIGLSGT